MSCCVPTCRNSKKRTPGLKLHKFPLNDRLQSTWLKVVKNPSLIGKTKIELSQCGVCSEHFEEDNYRSGGLHLSSTAIPSLNLPSKNESHPDNLKSLRYIIENSSEPFVIKNVLKWNIFKWNLETWSKQLGDLELQFRKNDFTYSKNPKWERNCEYVKMTMQDFIKIQSDSDLNYWLYFDYKYISEWFKNNKEFLKEIVWDDVGYPEKTGLDSTIWIGTKGAHTPCHADTYGCNLIVQVFGRKRWIIFPPEADLKPLRVPYEESSVYSQLNFNTPDVDFKNIHGARTVILEPEDILFLPPKWWHYVENLDTSISINMWLPTEEDDRTRIEEAFVQLLVSQMVKDLPKSESDKILNPNSEELLMMDIDMNIDQLKKVLLLYKMKQNKGKSKRSAIISDFNSESVVPIPQLTDDDFQSLLHQKVNCTTENNSSTTQETNNTTILEQIINTVCDPDILDLITKKFISNCNI